MLFKESLLDIMEKRGLARSDVSKMTGIPATLISNYCLGHAVPSLENAVRIADALKVTVDQLVGRGKSDLLNDEEYKVLRKLRVLNPTCKERVLKLLNFYHIKFAGPKRVRLKKQELLDYGEIDTLIGDSLIGDFKFSNYVAENYGGNV